MTADIVPLLWKQKTVEKILICRNCDDVCSYQYPASMPLKIMECDYCQFKGHLSDKIPRSRRF